MGQNIKIDENLCKKCGLCSEVCPMNIMKKSADGKIVFRYDRINFCIKCGQCMAICPAKSIIINGLSYKRDFFELPKKGSYEKSFIDLIMTRRSVRNFKSKPIPEAILKKIVDSVNFAPPGFTPIKTSIIMIQNKEILKRALCYMIETYDFLNKVMNNHIMRFFIRQKVGKKTFKIMKNDMVPVMKTRLPELKRGTEDTITRNAPAMMIFHADKNKISYKEDGLIALTYAFLAAHAFGLGATAINLVPPVVNSKKELKELFKIPVINEVTGAVILGYPKYSYIRGIKRELKSVEWIL